MSQRLPIVGFIIAVIIAIFAFSQQQQAVEQARAAMTQAAQAKEQGVTAVAVANEAATAQADAQSTEAAALVNAHEAATAQSRAEADRSTAQAEIDAVATTAARLAASGTQAVNAAQSTITADTRAIQTAQSESAADLATKQADLDALATTQADTASQLATVTAQIDLAEFARQSAEEDRLTALTQVWSDATLIADTNNQLATAQAIIAGVTPTPPPQPTTVTSGTTQGEALALVNDFRSDSGQLTFQYPEGWDAREAQSGAVFVASDSRLFENTNEPVTPRVFIQILVAPAEAVGLDPDVKPLDSLAFWVGVITEQNTELKVGESREVTLGDYRAARVEGSDATDDVVITTIDAGNNIVGLILAFSSPGDMSTYLGTIDALIASIAYQPG